MALNRLGAPRKTHIPSNKPLGKLSTYVRAFTLIVPETRSETVIGKRFGYNHVKHAIKHLCESNKELIELTAKQLVSPQCSSTSSNNMDVINNNRKQSNHHVRHKNLSNRRLAGSIERKSKISDTHASMKMMNSSEHAPKKKKSNNNPNPSRNGSNNNKNKNSKKINHKIVKNKTSKRIQVTTTTKVTTTTTQHSVRDIDVTESTVPENYDDELDDSSASIPLTSNGQSGFTSDEDYQNDK